MCALKSVDSSHEPIARRIDLEIATSESPASACLEVARDEPNGRPAEDAQRQALLYIDPWALTRDCLGLWLQSSLSEFEIHVLADPEEITRLVIASDRIREAIVNTGPEPIASLEVAQTVAQLRELLPAVPIALLSHHENLDSIRKAFALGVAGYIPASLAAQVAVGAVRLIGLGGTFAPAGALLSQDSAPPQEPADDAIIEGFTQRQSQILNCLRRGMANKLIAYELNMCESTVKVHIRNIMRKLNATNRTEVAYLTRDLFKEAAGLAGPHG